MVQEEQKIISHLSKQLKNFDKILIGLNFAVFFLTALVPTLTLNFGFRPADFFERFAIWQPVTYLFIHGGISHILFNMLALWMFGVELERLWGSRYFAKYYFAAGIGAAITTLIVSMICFSIAPKVILSAFFKTGTTSPFSVPTAIPIS